MQFFRGLTIMLQITQARINNSLAKARKKHPNFAVSLPWVVSIAAEEFGEFAQAINDDRLADARLEALDLIAVLIRFLEYDE